MKLFKRNSFDQNTVNFVIFGAMRFGTNLLQEKLNYFSDILCLGEMYNPAFVGVDRPHLHDFRYAGYGRNDQESKELRAKDPFLLLEKVAIQAHNDHKLVGFRMFEGHNHSVRNVLLNDYRVKKILLHRDLVSSYVSLKLAQQSGKWIKRDDGKIPQNKIQFDPENFTSYVRKTQGFFQPLLQTLKATRQKFKIISYEDILNDRKVQKLGRFIGSRKKINYTNTVLKKQSPDSLEDKIENYTEVYTFLKKFTENAFGGA